MKNENRSDKHRRPKRLWLKITLSVLGILVLGVGAYVYSVFNYAKATVNEQMNEKVNSIDEKVTKKKVNEREPLNILLLGVDKRAGDSGRSDSLMVLSLDPKDNKMQLVSIPRDTRAMIVGKGFEDKINHAYAYGGTDMSIQTVENLLDIELDYFVEMNMEGLADLVDSIGGIKVQNELDWVANGFRYTKGELSLNGSQTMGFVRMRYEDPRGDLGRTERQRKVIGSIIDKGASVATVGKINDVIDVLGKNMATNMDFADMQDLLLNYTDVRRNVVSYMIEGSGTKIDGTYYYLVPDEEINKVHEMIEKMNS